MGEIWAQAGKRAGADAGDILRVRGRWLAWLLFGLSAACVALDVTLLALNRDTPQPDTWGFRGAAVLLAMAYAGLGQLLARHRPENAIGWLFLIISLFMGVGGLGADYAAYALLTRRGALPGGLMAGWAASWLWPAYIGLLIFALLLFPTGRLPSVRWRSIAWLLAASVGGWIVTLMLKPGPLWFAPFVLNPLTIAGDPAMWKLISNVSGIGTGISILAVMVGLIQRLRCAKGVERQQLKWFAYVSVLIGVIGLINETANLTLGPANKSGPKAFQFLTVAVFLTIPLTVALAILRYRLYDIDRILNRTLVYGTLSAGIVLTYVLLVGFFGALLRVNVDLAAGLVTLALTAVMFQPLRTRLTNVVNRLAHGPPTPTPDPEGVDARAAFERRLRPRWLTLAHVGWLAWAALTFFILLAAIPYGYSPYVGQAAVIGGTNDSLWYLPLLYLVSAAVSFLVAAVSLALATLLFWKRRDEPMPLLLSFYLLSYGVFVAGPFELTGGFFGQPYSSLISAFGNVWYFAPILLLYLFPSGRFVPRWSRWAALFLLPMGVIVLLDNGRLNDLANPNLYLLLSLSGVLAAAGIYAQIYRYRHAATPIERHQIKWVVFGLSFYLFLLVATSVPYLIIEQTSAHRIIVGPVWAPIGDAIWWLLMSILPLTFTVAVMRYRAWDVDIIINRTLVFGALTAGVVALYILLVGGMSALSQSSGNLLISLVATGLIAFLFQPLRERLQRGVNRLMYGERDEPYALMARLGQNMETTNAPDTMLLALVRTIAQALKLPYVAIETCRDGNDKIAAAYGDAPTEMKRFPLPYQGETVGDLLVAPRRPNEPLSAADLNLLRIIAQQAGMAVHAVQLTEDLQHSRERLVVAREEERRRIRRDLHDGLGPALASLAMQADNAREWTHTDPVRIDAALADITAGAQDALQDIRRLVYGLRPPALDELGLVGALRQAAANSSNGVEIEIDAAAPLPLLPAAVEVAAYRIAQETMNNVAQHSHAQKCTVAISAEEELRLEISDDGIGLPPAVRSGVGLISMRERAAELGGSCVIESAAGGGTRVIARLPLPREQAQVG